MQADFSVELGRDAPALEIPWHSNDPHVRYYDLKKPPELVPQIPEAVAYPELASFLSRINATGFPMATAKCDVWSSSQIAPEEEIFGDRKFVSYIDLVFVDQEDQCSFGKHEAFVKELCRLLSHAPEIAATVELVIRNCYYHQKEFFEKSGEPNGPQSPATMGASEISSSGNDDPINHDLRADIAIDDELARVKEHDERVAAPERKLRMNGTTASVTGFCITAYVTGFGGHDHDPARRWAIALHLLQNAIVQLNTNSQPKH
jgi:hypothetical protein